MGQTTCYPIGVRKHDRLMSAALGIFLVPFACGLLAAACGSEPVGIEVCRAIEAARCEATTACGVSEAESQYCVAFYRDQCLHGIANTKADLSSDATSACVEGIRAVAECARTGAMTMAQCPTITLVADKDPASVLPCAIVKRTPHVLSACAFLVPDNDEGSSSNSSSSSSSSASSTAGNALPPGPSPAARTE